MPPCESTPTVLHPVLRPFAVRASALRVSRPTSLPLSADVILRAHSTSPDVLVSHVATLPKMSVTGIRAVLASASARASNVDNPDWARIHPVPEFPVPVMPVPISAAITAWPFMSIHAADRFPSVPDDYDVSSDVGLSAYPPYVSGFPALS